MTSNYDRYFLYKMKYVNLKNKMNGGDTNLIPNIKDNLLIYNKKVSDLPNEYLQNILFIIITNNKLNINDFYINYIQDPVEHNKSSSKNVTINIYALNDKITEKTKSELINQIDTKLKKYLC